MISALYHRKRERFLDGADRTAQAVSVLAGAAAFSTVFTDGSNFSIPAAIVAVVGTISLCFGPSAKARLHAELARKFKLLHAEIVSCTDPFTEEVKRRFESKILILEAEEPAALGALTRQSENELSVAFDRREDVIPLNLFQRLFKNWFDFDMATVRSDLNTTQRFVSWVFGIPTPKDRSGTHD